MPKLPYMPFYFGDHLSDPCVRQCQPATVGVWLHLLGAMWNAGQVGEITGTIDRLAGAAGFPVAAVLAAIEDLRVTGTADVTISGGIITVVCRRMRRESKGRKQARDRQTKFRGKSRNADSTLQETLPFGGSSSSSSLSTSDTTAPDPVSSGAENAPDPVGRPMLGGQWFSDLWHEHTGVLMAQNLQGARLALEDYAVATNVTTLDGLQQLARRAVQTFTVFREACSPGFQPAPNGTGFLNNWDRIQLMLAGDEPAAGGGGAMPIAKLQFGGGPKK